MPHPPLPTARILDMGDDRMLGQRPDGRKIWLRGPVVPGDLVRYRPEGKGGETVDLLQPAPDRIPPPCPHFDHCPGCALQPLPYPRQLALKADRIVQTLQRLGGLTDVPFRGLQGSQSPYGTRNKLDFTLDGPRLGYRAGSGRVDVHDCLQGDPLLREWIPPLREWIAQNPAHRLHRALLRTDGPRSGVLLLFRGEMTPAERDHWRARVTPGGSLRGVALQADWKQPWELLAGKTTLAFTREHETHHVPYDGFFQIHDRLAHRLVDRVMEHLRDDPPPTVLDLFCGVGAFTLPAARIADTVLGLDTRPGKGPFQKADLRRGLPPKVRSRRWHTVITDPPRAGMDKRLTAHLRDQVRPRRLLYISCNPATLARDLQRLTARRQYRLTSVEGFDLFPQTPHVETLCELLRHP